ncbi:MAG: hypothetical protein OEV59_00675 [Deltaproteobacteria bacterium]|nr:hypothetical protein [Deltaproteobacteria bacterium]
MELSVTLESESGEVEESVLDKHGCLVALLPDISDSAFPLLRFISRHGDTIFNKFQMRQFILDWRKLRRQASVPEEINLLEEIMILAERCAEGVHLYLRFSVD